MAEPGDLSVYVHFPWCLARCPYCDFLSLVGEPRSIPHERYADQVLRELDARAARLGPRRLVSVFFGGGTPSLWEPRQLLRVLGGLRAAFSVAPELEVTVEVNPSSATPEVLAALAEGGVDRVSVGVQSLDGGRLGWLGRLHDGRRALDTLADAARAGLRRRSADLLLAVPGQEPAQAVAEALALVDAGVEHLSAYLLTIEPGTRFGELARAGRLPQYPDEQAAESYLAVRESLERRGWRHYEISNHARPGGEARHNLAVWRGGEYLGLGLGAWGTLRIAPEGSVAFRYRNTAALERYLDWDPVRLDPLQEAPAGALAAAEPIDAATWLRERLLLGLRLAEGVDLHAAADAVGRPDLARERARRIDAEVARGRLVKAGSRLSIPPDRWLVADGVIAGLL